MMELLMGYVFDNLPWLSGRDLRWCLLDFLQTAMRALSVL